MHVETRGVRNFSMHQTNGGRTTKLIAVKLVYLGYAGN